MAVSLNMYASMIDTGFDSRFGVKPFLAIEPVLFQPEHRIFHPFGVAGKMSLQLIIAIVIACNDYSLADHKTIFISDRRKTTGLGFSYLLGKQLAPCFFSPSMSAVEVVLRQIQLLFNGQDTVCEDFSRLPSMNHLESW